MSTQQHNYEPRSSVPWIAATGDDLFDDEEWTHQNRPQRQQKRRIQLLEPASSSSEQDGVVAVPSPSSFSSSSVFFALVFVIFLESKLFRPAASSPKPCQISCNACLTSLAQWRAVGDAIWRNASAVPMSDHRYSFARGVRSGRTGNRTISCHRRPHFKMKISFSTNITNSQFELNTRQLESHFFL